MVSSRKNGQVFAKSCQMLMLAIRQTTNMHTPTGGVIRPKVSSIGKMNALPPRTSGAGR